MMIDNLICDTMKQIWNNLELYYESYDFSNFFKFFQNFLEFKIDLFDLNTLK